MVIFSCIRDVWIFSLFIFLQSRFIFYLYWIKLIFTSICTEEQINTAKKLIEEGKSKRKTADIVGIDESTLRKRLRLKRLNV